MRQVTATMLIYAQFTVFGGFSLMVSDGQMDGYENGYMDIRTDRPSYRDARTHLKSTLLIEAAI